MSQEGTHNSTILHKTVSQSSKDWVSPFRTSDAVSPKKKVANEANYSSYISAGSVPVVKVDETAEETANEETVEEEAAKAELAEEQAEATAEATAEANKEEEEEETPLNPEQFEEEEYEIVDPEEEPLEAEEIEEVVVIDEPIETETEQPAAKQVEETPAKASKSIKPAVMEIPPVIKSHPKMLRRYKDNFNIASQIMNKNKIENLDRRVDLGAGLVLTEEQIYELAKKKLEPLMKQIDDRVAENNARDAEKAAQIETNIRLKDEAVVAGMLATYKATVDSKTKDVQDAHDTAFKELEQKAESSKTSAAKYIEDEKAAIIKDQQDAEQAEEDAITQHATNKEDLIKNADQYKLDKENELESFKSKQIEEKELAEKFENDATELKSKQVELQKELDSKKAELEEKIKKVEALIAEKHEKKETIRTSNYRAKVADRSFGIINSKFLQATTNVGVLSSQIGLLTDRFNAHSTKIDHYSTAGKDILQSKKADATKAAEDWQAHLDQVRLEEAQKQEQIKIAAEEERKRLEQEKIEEEARLAKEKEEEEARLAKEKEEAKQLAEKKKAEEEEENARIAAEVERLKEKKRLNEERLKLEKSVKEQEEAKTKSSTVGSTLGGVAGGLATGALGLGAGVATGVAVGGSGIASGASNIASNATNLVPQGKSVEMPTDFHDELKNSNAGTSTNIDNPFYKGEFNDVVGKESDLPSIIHEEEEHLHDTSFEHKEPVLKDEEPKEEEPKEEATGDNETITDKTESEPTESSELSAFPDSSVPVSEPLTQISNESTNGHPAVVRRRSMVDEAIANMTPEQIAKMNTPLAQQIRKVPSKSSVKENIPDAPRSRSNSLTSKFKLKSRSRSNSINQASNRKTVNKSEISAPIAITTGAGGAAAGVGSTVDNGTSKVKSAAPVSNNDPIDTTTTNASIAPSGLSNAEISEAKQVEIKSADHESPEKVYTNEDDDDDDYDLDSDLDRGNVNPVFTEKIGNTEETAPTTAHSADPNDNLVEVSTLETVSSSEYRAHKDDPNYMIVHA